MIFQWTQYLTGATAVYCWLIAGVFLAFSDFVMKSLGAIPPAQAVTAMQSINVLVYRSVFMVGLFAVCGVSVLLILNGALYGGTGSGLLTAAAIIYLVTVIGVSAVGNIPLNNELAVMTPTSLEASQLWERYLNHWVNWNHIRTIGAATAAALMTIATFKVA